MSIVRTLEKIFICAFLAQLLIFFLDPFALNFLSKAAAGKRDIKYVDVSSHWLKHDMLRKWALLIPVNLPGYATNISPILMKYQGMT